MAARSALGWYRPSVGIPLGRWRLIVVYTLNVFKFSPVHFSSEIEELGHGARSLPRSGE